MCGLHLKIDRSIDNPSPAATGLVARGMRRTSPRFPFMFWLPLKKKASWFVFAWHLSPSIPSCFGHFSRSARLSKKNNFFYSKVVRCVRYLFFGFLFFFYTHRLRTFETKRIRPLWTGGGGGGWVPRVARLGFCMANSLSLSLSLSTSISGEDEKPPTKSAESRRTSRIPRDSEFRSIFPFFFTFQTTNNGRGPHRSKREKKQHSLVFWRRVAPYAVFRSKMRNGIPSRKLNYAEAHRLTANKETKVSSTSQHG